MLDTLKKLEALQEIDLQIDNLLRKKSSLPQLLQEQQNQITALNQTLQTQTKAFDEVDRARKQQLGALELNEERLKRSQEKSEKVKTNQELQALTKEIESLKKSSEVIGENEKKIAAELNVHKTAMEQTQKALNEIQSKIENEKQTIVGQEQKIDDDLKVIQAKRNEMVKDFQQQRVLAFYDKIRPGKQGIGVAIAQGGNCKACNMKIPPQIYNNLQRGTEMHTCPMCQRILLYKEPVKSDTDSFQKAHA